jgi:hypothetical protein
MIPAFLLFLMIMQSIGRKNKEMTVAGEGISRFILVALIRNI